MIRPKNRSPATALHHDHYRNGRMRIKAAELVGLRREQWALPNVQERFGPIAKKHATTGRRTPFSEPSATAQKLYSKRVATSSLTFAHSGRSAAGEQFPGSSENSATRYARNLPTQSTPSDIHDRLSEGPRQVVPDAAFKRDGGHGSVDQARCKSPFRVVIF